MPMASTETVLLTNAMLLLGTALLKVGLLLVDPLLLVETVLLVEIVPVGTALLDGDRAVVLPNAEERGVPEPGSNDSQPVSQGVTADRIGMQVRNWTVKNPGAVPTPTCEDYASWTVAQLRKECSERKLRVPRKLDTGEVNQNTSSWEEVAKAFQTNTTDYNGLFTFNDPRYIGLDPSVIVQHDAPRLYDMWKKVNTKYIKAFSKFDVSGQNSNDFYEFCDGSLDAAYVKVSIK
ncbi:hypothetical protein PInf_025670 [Phytophthora infestans]|nr:hypothetical protein PInf_025670 [Phytophthora infestans]